MEKTGEGQNEGGGGAINHFNISLLPALRERVRKRQRVVSEGSRTVKCSIWAFYIWTSSGGMALQPTRYRMHQLYLIFVLLFFISLYYFFMFYLY